MVGTWAAGVLTGGAEYHQPGFHLAATYVKGVPAGAATVTAAAFRKLPAAPGAAAPFRAVAARHLRDLSLIHI